VRKAAQDLTSSRTSPEPHDLSHSEQQGLLSIQ